MASSSFLKNLFECLNPHFSYLLQTAYELYDGDLRSMDKTYDEMTQDDFDDEIVHINLRTLSPVAFRLWFPITDVSLV
jgi:hypothetical protein